MAIKHGKYGTRAYKVWERMKRRCLNKNDPSFKKYGGKGIKICERWMSFRNFYEDMGECKEGMSLDRLDPKGNYEKNNCRWATMFEQGSENKSSLRVIAFNGKKQNVRAWERELGFNYGTISMRLKRGWPIDKALGTKLIKYDGVSYDKFRGKWKSYVKKKGKQIFIGRFDTKKEAMNARKNFIKSP